MERTTLSIEWKSNDDGTLEGYASTFGNVDLGGDVIVPGAFAKTSKEVRQTGIPLLADHVASTASVLGTIFEAREDRKGLRIKARFSKAASAQDTRTKLLEGHLSKLSIGYEPTKFAFEEREGKTVRLLQEIKLWETSVVVFPMNPEATIERVKSLAGGLNDADRKALATAIVEADEDKATANEVRERLNALVREAYGSDSADVWVRDWDESKVWFDVWSGDDSGIYEQAYSDDGDVLTLEGERAKVRAVTTYVPDEKSSEPCVRINGRHCKAHNTCHWRSDGCSDATHLKRGMPVEDSDTKTGAGEAEARHAEAEDTKDAAPAGDDAGASWDRYASEAVLAGRDPEALADPAERAGLSTRLELMEQSLKTLDEPVHPDIRAGLSASLRLMEDDINRATSAVPAGDRAGMAKGLALLEDDLRQPTNITESE